MWIDSHCHLNHDRLLHLGGAAQVADNARRSGVEGMLSVCCRASDEFPGLLETVRPLANVWCTVGVHPHEASDDAEKSVTSADLVRLANSDPKVVAIGETGLDYYYKFASREDQHLNFRKNLSAGIEAGLPVVVHSREAEEDTMRIIREEGQGTALTGVMHCFSSKRVLAEEALAFGFYVSFSGILTFKKSDELREIAKDVPLDRVLVETDAPYLAPEPHRKEINQPALMPHTGRVLADIHGITEEDLARITRENTLRLFAKAKETHAP